jgi:hypothetical protein
MVAGSSTLSIWLRMSRPGLPNFTTGPKTRSQSARLSGFNFNGWLLNTALGARIKLPSQQFGWFQECLSSSILYNYVMDIATNYFREIRLSILMAQKQNTSVLGFQEIHIANGLSTDERQ